MTRVEAMAGGRRDLVGQVASGDTWTWQRSRRPGCWSPKPGSAPRTTRAPAARCRALRGIHADHGAEVPSAVENRLVDPELGLVLEHPRRRRYKPGGRGLPDRPRGRGGEGAVSPTISLLVKGGGGAFHGTAVGSSQSTRTMPLSGVEARLRRAWVVVPMGCGRAVRGRAGREGIVALELERQFCSIHSTSVIRVARCSSRRLPGGSFTAAPPSWR